MGSVARLLEEGWVAMTDPCPRRRCPGQLTEWATEIRSDGTRLTWLVCDQDTRHTVERDTAPAAQLGQDSLPGIEVGR